MQTEKGRENFQNQILQIVGSIQNTNDLDVHMALILAPSYANQVRNQYYMENTLSQSLRDYVDTFGFCQKNMNAMDIIIEDTKQLLASWGGEEPDFMLVAPKLCFQLTMTQVWWVVGALSVCHRDTTPPHTDPRTRAAQERTSYLAQGDDGKQLLREGPILNKYRGLNVIKSRAFSMEEGGAPRDVLRRRVRTAEFYYGSLEDKEGVMLYDEFTDNFCRINRDKLIEALKPGDDSTFEINGLKNKDQNTTFDATEANNIKNWLLIRPCIEHYMLAAIIGRGGLQHLGATLWGQTELSVFDDGQHGVWGMTYKYHGKFFFIDMRFVPFHALF